MPKINFQNVLNEKPKFCTVKMKAGDEEDEITFKSPSFTDQMAIEEMVAKLNEKWPDGNCLYRQRVIKTSETMLKFIATFLVCQKSDTPEGKYTAEEWLLYADTYGEQFLEFVSSIKYEDDGPKN